MPNIPGMIRFGSWISNIKSDNLLEDFFISAIGYFMIVQYWIYVPDHSGIGLMMLILGILLFFCGLWLLHKVDWDGGAVGETGDYL